MTYHQVKINYLLKSRVGSCKMVACVLSSVDFCQTALLSVRGLWLSVVVCFCCFVVWWGRLGG